MRYYRIELAPQQQVGTPGKPGIFVADIGNTGGAFVFTSHPKGTNGPMDPGALNVELDVLIAQSGSAMGDAGSFVKIWGVGLQDIIRSSDFNGMALKCYGGMAKGLPLANPKQAGLLFQGIVQQGIGNWVGNEMALELVVFSDAGSIDKPKNLVLDWKKDQKLGDAVQQTLSTAFPGYTLDIQISPDLVATEDRPSYYATVGQLGDYLNSVSRSIITADTYQGVVLVQRPSAFFLTDGTNGMSGIDTITVPTTKAPISIAFNDLVGQPTWVGPGQIQLTVVMRGDLRPGNYIKLPTTPVVTLSQSLSQFRQRSSFQGDFYITRMRHLGNYRQPSGESWVTTIDCTPAVAA